MAHTLLWSIDGNARMHQEAHRIMQEILHRDEDVVPLAQMRMGQREPLARMLLPLDEDEVTVNGARPVTGELGIAHTLELILHAKQGIEQHERMELRANLRHGVGNRRRVRTAHQDDPGKRNLVDELDRMGKVTHAVTHVRPK